MYCLIIIIKSKCFRSGSIQSSIAIIIVALVVVVVTAATATCTSTLYHTLVLFLTARCLMTYLPKFYSINSASAAFSSVLVAASSNLFFLYSFLILRKSFTRSATYFNASLKYFVTSSKRSAVVPSPPFSS